MKNDIKTDWIKARVSSREKENILMFCESNGYTLSELIRVAVREKIEREA